MAKLHLLSPLAFVLVTLPSLAPAGDLREASLNQIVNDVKVVDPRRGARAAVLKETIKDELAVTTGRQSRAELLFQDNTLTRLGAETFFHFKAGTRDLTLDQGTMLLQVPKGRGGARVRTGSVAASVTGTTIMIQHLPHQQVRVMVLEGSLNLAPTNRPEQVRKLTAGTMVTMDPSGKRVPEPVAVDLRKVVSNSSLIDARGFKGDSDASPRPLASLGLIRTEIALQDARLDNRAVIASEPRTRKVEASDRNVKIQVSALRAREVVVNESVRETKAKLGETTAAVTEKGKVEASDRKLQEKEEKARKHETESEKKAREKAEHARKELEKKERERDHKKEKG